MELNQLLKPNNLSRRGFLRLLGLTATTVVLGVGSKPKVEACTTTFENCGCCFGPLPIKWVLTITDAGGTVIHIRSRFSDQMRSHHLQFGSCEIIRKSNEAR